jgi:Xaa-Pro dipeptidase
MRSKARGTPRDASLASQADVIINAVDSFHIRLAVSGTSCDKYPGKRRRRPSTMGPLRALS